MSEYSNIIVEEDGDIAIIKINRPHNRNAVDRPTAEELYNAFHEFDNDASKSIAVLSGNGGHFCAGADLKALSSQDQSRINRVQRHGQGPMGPTRMQLSKPVIAAVEGFAVAGGLELAIWCDLRVCAKDAKFGVFCRRFGVPLVDGGTVRLPRLIGHSHAMDMILTGREVGAFEALAMGLANRLCEPGEALNASIALAKKIASFPKICMQQDRLSAIEQWDFSFQNAMNNETDHGLFTISSGETLKGAQSFNSGKGKHGKSI